MIRANRPDRAALEEQSGMAFEIQDSKQGPSIFTGMTFEEGVQQALEWVLGNYEEPPFDRDEVTARLKGGG